MMTLKYKPGLSNSAADSVESSIVKWAGNRTVQCSVTCDGGQNNWYGAI